MADAVIVFDNVHKTYRDVKAVDGVSFDVAPSTCFGLLGRNGAGKSTIMRLLYRKAERDPAPRGTISVFGFDPERDELEIKCRSGVVPQEDNLDDELSVDQNLRVFARLYGMPAKRAERRIAELLEFMELRDKARASIRELSGGMKRRLVIVRALLNEPRLLILDEPTTGLDPQVRHTIWDKLRQLKRGGLTIMLTTHYMEEAFQLCDDVLIIENGKAVLRGNPKLLLGSHIEPYVLEFTDVELAPQALERLPAGTTRTEKSDESVRVYANDYAVLRAVADQLPPGDYHLRPSTLEDVFLKATGRRLDARQ
ncbi:MAG TPA: ABC transporter ATP-binding protein [Polyangia bacterium]|jgi:lipooligosaccharide transport system ATP-binding protein